MKIRKKDVVKRKNRWGNKVRMKGSKRIGRKGGGNEKELKEGKEDNNSEGKEWEWTKNTDK